MKARHDLSVMHVGPGRYQPLDRSHVTYEIWRELASGFQNYHVVARSMSKAADWSDGNLRVTLLSSRTEREAEFLIGQFRSVPIAMRSKPDVIVCQSPALGGIAAILIDRLIGVKILMELHGAEFFVSSTIGSRLWVLGRLTRFALKRADRIRALSVCMQQRMIEHYGADLEARTTIVPPRVNLSRFDSSELKRARRGALTLTMVGAVNQNKGQLRLIDALKAVPFDVELHVAGTGPDLEECRKRSVMLAESQSSLRVICEGYLTPDAVAGLLLKSDLLIIYSFTEGTPRAAMEAMAAAVPVVTTDAGFCADIVSDGIEGFVLGSDPDSQIIDVLARFNSDRSLLTRMGVAARTRARRDYDSVRLFEDYRTLIADTANR